MGMAVPYNEVAFDRKHGRLEQFRPGAFEASIRRGRVTARFNHERHCFIAYQGDLSGWPRLQRKCGTLVFPAGLPQQHGLYFELAISDPDDVRRVREAQQARQIAGCSIGIGDLDEAAAQWDGHVWTWMSVPLMEISILIGRQTPAYGATWARIARES